MKRWFFLLLLLLALPSHAETCTVVKIADGDTLTVRCPNQNRNEKIRLLDIDAPERSQTYGAKSRQALANLCRRGEPIEVQRAGKDKYDRTLARLTCNGVDVQNHMVENGWAWSLRRPTDPHLKQLQVEAQQNRRGLWADDKPMEPWKYRHLPPQN